VSYRQAIKCFAQNNEKCFDFKPLTIWSQAKHLGPCQTRNEVDRATSSRNFVVRQSCLCNSTVNRQTIAKQTWLL